METGTGFAGRIAEKVATGIIFAILILLGVSIWRMEPSTRWAIWNGIWRSAAWLTLAAALPWIARLFMARILELGTNWAGVALLGAFALVDAVVGLLLLRDWPAGGWAWLAALAALAVAATYNYLVTEYVAEQAGG